MHQLYRNAAILVASPFPEPRGNGNILTILTEFIQNNTDKKDLIIKPENYLQTQKENEDQ